MEEDTEGELSDMHGGHLVFASNQFYISWIGEFISHLDFTKFRMNAIVDVKVRFSFKTN